MTTDTDKEALARRAVAAWQKCGLNWSPRMEFVDPKGCLLGSDDPWVGHLIDAVEDAL